MWAATEARSFGRGGIVAVCRATGLDHKTVQRGTRELNQANPPDAEQIRQRGGGRRTLIASHPKILQALESLVESAVRGDPESPLRWVSKSAYHLADALRAQNYAVSPRSIPTLLKAAGYSLQVNRKVREGSSHLDRNAQFEYIHQQVLRHQSLNQPVISVDTKKKENIGNFKNNGSEYSKKGHPVEVNTYDFQDKTLGKVAPYGVYDLTLNQGWVNVGITR